MMKTILVPASGSSTDEPVFAAALAAAQATAAHLDFYHVRLSTGQAAAGAPHSAFCIGEALPAALQVLTDDISRLSKAARGRMQALCERHGIEIRERPESGHGVSASFLEESGYGCDRLMLLARHSDLVVFGRRSHIDYLPSTLVEDNLDEWQPTSPRGAIRGCHAVAP
jgi:nucleotide-binding universal stress UspA family protein